MRQGAGERKGHPNRSPYTTIYRFYQVREAEVFVGSVALTSHLPKHSATGNINTEDKKRGDVTQGSTESGSQNRTFYSVVIPNRLHLAVDFKFIK